MRKITLASGSPRRKELLLQMGLSFDVVPSSVEETIPDGFSFAETVKILAKQKAESVVAISNKDSIVIGADTIVVFEEEILGKPRDQNHAFQMLKALQSREHLVFTGLCLIDNSSHRILLDHEKTIVKMATIDDDEIARYIATGEPMDKAGAYGIQGRGGMFIEEIRGCYYNVVGLPLAKLRFMLKQLGIQC
ncbi:MAG: Maf family protein [Clostridia bacterium]|jgi:septum formation protein